MSTISSVGSAATQPPIKKRKVLDTNQIPALTSTYITWKDHTIKKINYQPFPQRRQIHI